jgi:hypothetical protein
MFECISTYVRTRTDKAHIRITLWICTHGYMFCISTRSPSQISVKFLNFPGESFESTVQSSTTVSSQILNIIHGYLCHRILQLLITPKVDIKPLNGQHISHIYTTHVSSLHYVTLQEICFRENRKSCLYVLQVPTDHSWCS